MERGMKTELPPDDSDKLLEKADALLRRHQRQPLAQPRTAATPPSSETKFPPAEISTEEPHLEAFSLDEPLLDESSLDDIPTLTDVVETAPAASVEAVALIPLPDNLEARLYHELESRIAPQLTAAFQHALAGLLEEARQQIHLAVRTHVEQETPALKPDGRRDG
jgi:hypothetical protein